MHLSLILKETYWWVPWDCLCAVSLPGQYWLFLDFQGKPSLGGLSIVLFLSITKKFKEFGEKELNGHKLSLRPLLKLCFILALSFLLSFEHDKRLVPDVATLWSVHLAGTRGEGEQEEALEVIWWNWEEAHPAEDVLKLCFRLCVHYLQHLQIFKMFYLPKMKA